MVKQIETLIEDIYALFDSPEAMAESIANDFGTRMGHVMRTRVIASSGSGHLRMSNIGTPCARKLYYSVNKTGTPEELLASVRMKFIYGDILEEMLLTLAEAAGHTVEGQQDELVIHGIKGHRDAVIDGVLVDVKSASPFGFKKFKEGLSDATDGFGYIPQLQIYLEASQDDPLVTDKNRAAFFAIDKVSGQICLDFHMKRPIDFETLIEERRAAMGKPEAPRRRYMPEADGASGNLKLPIVCSYCQHKWTCYGDKLSAWAYSSGPRFLTHVAKAPKVPEITEEVRP